MRSGGSSKADANHISEQRTAAIARLMALPRGAYYERPPGAIPSPNHAASRALGAGSALGFTQLGELAQVRLRARILRIERERATKRLLGLVVLLLAVESGAGVNPHDSVLLF